MKTSTKIVTGVVAVTLAVSAAGHELNTREVQQRFPTLDKRQVRIAYWRMMWAACTNQIPQIIDYDDLQIDAIFLEFYSGLR